MMFSGNSNKLASFKKGIHNARQQNVENLGIIDLQWEKCVLHPNAFNFDLVCCILACNEDIHKSFDEFEFRSDSIHGCGVSCT